jgi:hypothetical protein
MGVGLYMAANGAITILALYLSRETRDMDMSAAVAPTP